MEYSLNVLVIDDEEIILETVKAAMDFLGHKSLLAKTGEEGISIFSENKDDIDVVLLDSNMPGFDGLFVLNELKKINDCVDVILTTGFVDDEVVRVYKDAGVKRILPKPFDLSTLSRIISEVHQERMNTLSSKKDTDSFSLQDEVDII